MNKPKDIDTYISEFPEETQKRLTAIRELGHEVAPNATEAIKYGIPTFVGKKNLFHFAGYKNHIGFYPTPSGIESFSELFAAYPQGKGSIQFPLDQELPLDIIRKIMEYRMTEDS